MHQKIFFDFKYIGIALIFLIDLNINNIDILPDFIAVLFFLKAIGKAYFINESFAEARTFLKVLCVVSIVKFTIGIITVIFLRDSYLEYESIVTVLTFVFALFELILVILILKKIFKAIEQLTYYSGSFSYAKNAATAMNVLRIFFIVKFILTFVVQVPYLLSDSDLEFWSMTFNSSFTSENMRMLMIPPCLIIQTLLGVFMLSIAVPFFTGLSKDEKLDEFVSSRITGRLTEDFFFNLKLNLKSAFAFFVAGCMFFIDIRIENIIFLPDFMTCVLFFFGVSQIAGNDKDMINKKLNIYLLINLPVSIAAYVLNSIYSVRIFTAFADELPVLYNLKTIADIFYHASIILFLLIFIEFYYFIKKLQYKHLEFSSDYLKKYYTAGEKILYKNINKYLIIGAAVFSVKIFASLMPIIFFENAFANFLYSFVLIVFAVWAVKLLISAKEDIYNYYN